MCVCGGGGGGGGGGGVSVLIIGNYKLLCNFRDDDILLLVIYGPVGLIVLPFSVCNVQY